MELFEEATELHKAGNFAEAEKKYDLLLTQNPLNAGLLATYGTLCLQTDRIGMAIHLFHAALQKLPQHSEILSNLGLAYKKSGQRDKSIQYLEKATQFNPTAEALSNYAGIFTQSANPQKAIDLCSKALEKNPELVIAHWNLGLALLESGHWDRAWDEHEWGLKMAPNASKMRVDRELGGKPYWDGTPDKTVVVYGEQGLGDEIMFASMIPDLMKTNKVIIESHPRLEKLFWQSFGVKTFGTRERPDPEWVKDTEFDYRISIGSLGKFFRKTKESFPGNPYLKADKLPETGKFRIGISWTGGHKASRVATRTVPLSWWKPILNQANVEFVSLQYTDCDEELALMKNDGYDIRTFDEIKAFDYSDTAKVVKSCDLIISVCTSVIHLAGALGVPCWVMVPNKPAWRYGVSGPMVWYRSVRLYRQKESWLHVVELIAEDLRNLLSDLEEKAA